MTTKESKFNTKKMNTEYSQPGSFSLDTIRGRHTPVNEKKILYETSLMQTREIKPKKKGICGVEVLITSFSYVCTKQIMFE